MILPEHGPQITLTGGAQYFANWKHVHFGPEGNFLEEPEQGKQFGPTGSEWWTDNV